MLDAHGQPGIPVGTNKIEPSGSERELTAYLVIHVNVQGLCRVVEAVWLPRHPLYQYPEAANQACLCCRRMKSKAGQLG